MPKTPKLRILKLGTSSSYLGSFRRWALEITCGVGSCVVVEFSARSHQNLNRQLIESLIVQSARPQRDPIVGLRLQRLPLLGRILVARPVGLVRFRQVC